MKTGQEALKPVPPVPAEAAASTANIIKLSKPVEWEGERVEELNLNLDDLTGIDLEAAEREWVMSGGVGMAETSKIYLLAVAARATGKRVEVLRRLSAKDYTKVSVMVQNFLLG